MLHFNLLAGLRFVATVIIIPAVSLSARSQQAAEATAPGPVINLGLPVGAIEGTHGTTPSGAATYNIPVKLPPGTAGFVPQLALSYNSQLGNGSVGMGWMVSGLSSIARMGQNQYHEQQCEPVAYSSNDRYTMDGLRLQIISGSYGANGATYATEAESFSKITSHGSAGSGPIWFSVVSKEGVTSEFGNSSDSRLMTNNGSDVMVWRLSKMTDAVGNYIEFKYTGIDRDLRIDEILYTGNGSMLPYNKVKFNYSSRPSTNTEYEGGSTLRSKYLLENIVITADGGAFKKYLFEYVYDDLYSFLKKIIEEGSDATQYNPTIFDYGFQAANFQSSSNGCVAGAQVDLFPADFNGDGHTDLMAAHKMLLPGSSPPQWQYIGIQIQRNNPGTNQHTSTYAGLGGGTWTSTPSCYLQDNYGQSYTNRYGTGDFNGDAQDDIFLARTHYTNPNTGCPEHILDNISVGLSANDATSFPLTTYSNPTGGYNKVWPVSRQFYQIGDFDGDGKTDFVTVLYNGSSVEAFLTRPTNITANELLEHTGTVSGPPLAIALPFGADLKVLDFDGDGDQEIMLHLSGACLVYSVYHTVAGDYKEKLIYNGSFPDHSHRIWSGDFNGDAKTDLLTLSGNGTWNIAYSTGIGLDVKPYSFSAYNNLTTTPSQSEHKVSVGDCNGDGKSDILHGYNVFSGSVATTSNLDIYYSRGDNTFSLVSNLNPVVLGGGSLIPTDINGDGRTDFIDRHAYTNPFTIHYFRPFGQERQLLRITDGMGMQTHFYYNLLTSGMPFYDQGAITLSPLNHIKQAICAVSDVQTPDGIGGLLHTTYSYSQAVKHLRGRGFLGFRSIVTTDQTRHIRTVAEYEIDPFFYVCALKKSTIFETTNNLLLGHSSFTNVFTSVGPKRWYQKMTSVTTFDALSNVTTTRNHTYDNWGNIISTRGSTSHAGVSLENIRIERSYVAAGPSSPTLSKLEIEEQTRVRAGQAPITHKTRFQYSGASGLMATKTEHFGLPLAVTTSYTYGAFGNVSNETSTAAGASPRWTAYDYDFRGRFIVKTTNAVNQTETRSYDPKWTTPTYIVGTDLTSAGFVYDGFGRLKAKTFSSGYTVNTGRSWDLSGNKVYYDWTTNPGHPDQKIWYDILGREVTRHTEGYTDPISGLPQTITQEKAYNNVGDILSETSPHYSSETPLTTTYSYDFLRRPTSSINALKSFSMSHTFSGGNRIVTTTNSLVSSQFSEVWTDPFGLKLSSNDPAGGLDFAYNSDYQQTEVSNAGTVLMSTTYDAYGRRSAVTEPNSGAASYSYTPWGEVSQQTTNAGVYSWLYNAIGQPTKRVGPEGATTYQYYPLSQPGRTGKLWRVFGFGGKDQGFTYDAFGRRTQIIEEINGSPFITSYGYSTPYDRPDEIEFPSGLVVGRTYDLNGYLQRVELPNAGSILFEGVKQNGLGQFTEYQRGNGITTNIDYHHGYPTQYSASSIQDLALNYDFSTGNLMNRADNIKGISESFTFDDNNRLIQSDVPGNSPVDVDYTQPSTNSSSKGNIYYKSDAGEYAYHGGQMNAVRRVTNPLSIIPINDDQDIAYTPFKRPETLTEGNVRLDYEYGADYERKVSILDNSLTGVTTTRIYGGPGYEYNTDNNGLDQHVHYIEGGDGLCAIVNIENGVESVYYPYKDHLGSIQTCTDNAGNIIAEQSFDSWGRFRNPNDWSYSSIPQPPTWLYRGYTGHEHLPEFGLVNMNARLYDPVLGRMLSPDNYVHRGNTQGYNRYTYALNNPLVNTDPNGEILLPFLLFTRQGFEIQKFISPVAVHINLPIGLHQRGIGYDVSVGLPKLGFASYRYHFGRTHYSNTFGGFSGTEKRYGGEWSVLGTFSYSSTYFHGRGFPNQTVATGTIGGPLLSFSYENDTDFMPIDLPGLPNIPSEPERDRYRTAAARVQVGLLSAEMILHTGEAGYTSNFFQTTTVTHDGQETTIMSGGTIADPQYSHGIFNIGIAGLRIGYDSEGIRHFFQNTVAHDGLTGARGMGDRWPWVMRTNRKSRLFFQFGESGLSMY